MKAELSGVRLGPLKQHNALALDIGEQAGEIGRDKTAPTTSAT